MRLFSGCGYLRDNYRQVISLPINNVMAFRYHSTNKQFVGAFRSAVADTDRLTEGTAFIPYVASAILLRILDSELRAEMNT